VEDAVIVVEGVFADVALVGCVYSRKAFQSALVKDIKHSSHMSLS